MYCSHFGLHRHPFNNTPDPSFYYSTPDHEEALATLQYATLNRKGFVLLTGEVGAGKTLIGRMFIRQIDRQASTAVITHTQLNAGQLLAAICSEFELDVPADATNLQLADRLQEFLLDQFARDRFVVVLLDEGQNLPDESFEALRMLGNLEADDAKLLQVCILGQPELRDRFSSEGMKQLDQRLFRRFHLAGLTQQQCAEYIQRRLSVAGCARTDLFTPGALEAIYRGSQGVPRLINRICDNALLAAYAQGRKAVDTDLVVQVLEQEGLNEPAGPSRGEEARSADERTEARIEQIYGSRPELIESQARWTSELEEKLSSFQSTIRGELQAAARVEDVKALAAAQETIRAEWSERLDRKLADLDGRLQSKLQSAANSNDIVALQRAQTTIRQDILQDFQARLLEMQQQLHSELDSRVTLEQLECIRESQAQARAALEREFQERLELLRTSLESELGALPKPSDLEQVRLSTADKAQTAEQLQQLRESQSRAGTAMKHELQEQLQNLRSGLGEELARLASSADLEQVRCSSATKRELWEQAEAVADQAVAIEDIFNSVGRHEDEIKELAHQAGSRFDQLNRSIEDLRANMPCEADLAELRASHETLARDVLDRFECKASELDAIRSSLDERVEQASGRQDAAITDLATRIDGQGRQLREVRRRLLEKYAAIAEKLAGLDEQFAGRAELETLRQAQAEQAQAVIEQFQANRQAVQKLVEDLTERFRATHQRLDNLACAAEADGADLAELRRVQAEDVTNLLCQLEDQRRVSQEQFEKCVSGWTQAQQEIEALRASAADASALEQLRERQNRHSKRILSTIAQHRQDLEALVADANQRCDAMLARLHALPEGLATSAEVSELAEESRSSKLALESAIRCVAEQCDHTASALRSLENRAASVDTHLEQIRNEHAQGLDQLVQRIEGVSDEYQHEFDTLKQHWAGLRGELQELAGSVTPVEKFEAAERLINRDMDALKQRLDGLTERRQKDVRTLVDVVQRLSDRVRQLEEMDRPQPVRVELRPRAADELAALNAAAESKTSELRELLAAGGSCGDALRERTLHVEEVMRDWNERSAAVQEQSDQLRTSAVSAGNILKAMRKCNEAIDDKLNSPAWHGQLQRGEQVAARLEQALPHYQRLENTVEALQEQRRQADALIKQLQHMLTEANRATARLGRVGALMAGAAGRNSMVQTIEAARDHDEQVRPTRLGGRKAANRNDIQDVTWPKYRTHVQASAG